MFNYLEAQEEEVLSFPGKLSSQINFVDVTYYCFTGVASKVTDYRLK
jgi:hypothetical protein